MKSQKTLDIDFTKILNMIRHSIKDDVAKINSSSQMIFSQMEPSQRDEAAKYFNSILISVDHLSLIVQKLSNIRYIELKKSDTDIIDLCQQVLHSLKSILDEHEVKVEVNVFLTNRIVNCDSVHIFDVLTNLILNSIDAMKGMGNKSNLTIMFSETGNKITVSIHDNGIGIPKENLKDIFTPFYSTKQNHNTNFGVGLTYCYNVMVKHKGRIIVDSESLKGTTMTLEFNKKKPRLFQSAFEED
jgi:two-component system sporulation sensor kinase B